MPRRGLEPPRFVAQDFESSVSTISPPRLFIFQLYIKNLKESIYWGGGVSIQFDAMYFISWGIGEEGGMNSE